MKTLNETKTGQLFNELGILSQAGEYAGEYQQEAFNLISELETLPEFEGNMWADIMHNNKGNCYAVYAEDALTCQDARCLYVQVDREDCKSAYDNAQTHIV
jgi:hypothetical protein